jgi:hypothetical protein
MGTGSILQVLGQLGAEEAGDYFPMIFRRKRFLGRTDLTTDRGRGCTWIPNSVRSIIVQ